MSTIYPACLRLEEGCFVINVPDVKGCVTTADTLDEAYDAIRDALAGCLCTLQDANMPLPKASHITELNQGGATVFLLDVDLANYRKEQLV